MHPTLINYLLSQPMKYQMLQPRCVFNILAGIILVFVSAKIRRAYIFNNFKHNLLMSQVIKIVTGHVFFDILKCLENAPFCVQSKKEFFVRTNPLLMSTLFIPSLKFGQNYHKFKKSAKSCSTLQQIKILRVALCHTKISNANLNI